MGQILHGSATTTDAVSRAIQHSKENLRDLAGRYGNLPYMALGGITPAQKLKRQMQTQIAA